MALPLYLAMTGAEIHSNAPVPGIPGYLSCHFSPWDSGLFNLPRQLPDGAMLILDDSLPPDGHDAQRICHQLAEQISLHRCSCLLLDFQRPDLPELEALAEALVSALSCPVGVSERYAKGLNCPVFLPPVPPDMPLSTYLAPWSGREVWLDHAPEGLTLTLTEEGCKAAPLPAFPREGLTDHRLHCHYSMEANDHCATFRLWRTPSDLAQLLQEAEELGVAKIMGLWQELI